MFVTYGDGYQALEFHTPQPDGMAHHCSYVVYGESFQSNELHHFLTTVGIAPSYAPEALERTGATIHYADHRMLSQPPTMTSEAWYYHAFNNEFPLRSCAPTIQLILCEFTIEVPPTPHRYLPSPEPPSPSAAHTANKPPGLTFPGSSPFATKMPQYSYSPPTLSSTITFTVHPVDNSKWQELAQRQAAHRIAHRQFIQRYESYTDRAFFDHFFPELKHEVNPYVRYKVLSDNRHALLSHHCWWVLGSYVTFLRNNVPGYDEYVTALYETLKNSHAPIPKHLDREDFKRMIRELYGDVRCNYGPICQQHRDMAHRLRQEEQRAALAHAQNAQREPGGLTVKRPQIEQEFKKPWRRASRAKVIKQYSTYLAHDFEELFITGAHPREERTPGDYDALSDSDHQIIFSSYGLYRFREFRAFLQKFPRCQEFVTALREHMLHDPVFAQELGQLPSCTPCAYHELLNNIDALLQDNATYPPPAHTWREQKIAYEQAVEQAHERMVYQQRNALDALARLAQNYDVAVNTRRVATETSDTVWYDRLEQRKAALWRSHDTNFAIHPCPIILGEDLATFLQRYELDPAHFFLTVGTDIQAQVQRELVVLFTTLAPSDLQGIIGQNPLFLDFLVGCADLAQGFNRRGNIVEATNLLDYTWFLADTALGKVCNSFAQFLATYPHLHALGKGVYTTLEHMYDQPHLFAAKVAATLATEQVLAALGASALGAHIAAIAIPITGVLLSRDGIKMISAYLAHAEHATPEQVEVGAAWVTEALLLAKMGSLCRTMTAAAHAEGALLISRRPCTEFVEAVHSYLVRVRSAFGLSSEGMHGLLPLLEDLLEYPDLLTTAGSAEKIIECAEVEIVERLPRLYSLNKPTMPVLRGPRLIGLAGNAWIRRTPGLITSALTAGVLNNENIAWARQILTPERITALEQYRCLIKEVVHEDSKKPSFILMLAEVDHEITQALETTGAKLPLPVHSAAKAGIEAIDLSERSLSHVFGLEIIDKNNLIGFSGFHCDRGDIMKKLGMVIFDKNIETLNGGITKTSLQLFEKGKACPKTFFPSHWSVSQTLEHAKQALNNITDK